MFLWFPASQAQDFLMDKVELSSPWGMELPLRGKVSLFHRGNINASLWPYCSGRGLVKIICMIYVKYATLTKRSLPPGTARTSREARPARQEGSTGKSPQLPSNTSSHVKHTFISIKIYIWCSTPRFCFYGNMLMSVSLFRFIVGIFLPACVFVCVFLLLLLTYMLTGSSNTNSQ